MTEEHFSLCCPRDVERGLDTVVYLHGWWHTLTVTVKVPFGDSLKKKKKKRKKGGGERKAETRWKTCASGQPRREAPWVLFRYGSCSGCAFPCKKQCPAMVFPCGYMVFQDPLRLPAGCSCFWCSQRWSEYAGVIYWLGVELGAHWLSGDASWLCKTIPVYWVVTLQ